MSSKVWEHFTLSLVHQYKVQILRWDLPDTTVGEAEDFFQEGSIMSPLSHSRPEIVVDDASDIAIPFRDAAPLEHLADK